MGPGGPLLDHMGGLVGHQAEVGPALAGSEPDVVAVSEGPRAQRRPGAPVGGPVVHPHPAQVDA